MRGDLCCYSILEETAIFIEKFQWNRKSSLKKDFGHWQASLGEACQYDEREY
ncbi:MAG: hypothetical protein LBQ00_05190 [Syntrophobacterales bacterium]|jgi:hypothetical protein|nr:hypothetical protein [Syntrophobacterales bacterium]